MQENYNSEQDNAPVSLTKPQDTTSINIQTQQETTLQSTKFCKHCGGKIPSDAVLCTLCGRQVEELHQQTAQQPQIVINNDNINTNTNIAGVGYGRMKNKWVAVLLCLFLGWLGIHRFYEGKILSGILYAFTLGLGGLGVLIDLIILLFKPNPYYV